MARREQLLNHPYNSIKYTAGIKLSKSYKTAAVVLLSWTGQSFDIVDSELLTCSSRLQEIPDWLEKHLKGADAVTAAGIDSSTLRYLSIQIPHVAESQRQGILKTQAEAVLPLSADQMALAWRSIPNAQGLQCQIVAARQSQLSPLVSRQDHIQVICPEAVGLVSVWKRCGDVSHQRCILLYRREQDILAVSIENGHLQYSTVIDADGADLYNTPPADLLLYDIQAELEAIQSESQEKVPVVILLEGRDDEFSKLLCSRIKDAGWTCGAERLKEIPKLDTGSGSIEAFGLALAVNADSPSDFDFRAAERVDAPNRKDGKRRRHVQKAIAITLALVLLVWATSYWKIKKDVKLMNRVIASVHEGLTVQEVLKEQAYRETIARARPDMMDLLTRIQKSQKGILLDSFEFEKGKPVKITATANSYDAAYQFQKELESQNTDVIKAVQLLEPRMDSKGQKVNFTLTLHYLNFSK